MMQLHVSSFVTTGGGNFQGFGPGHFAMGAGPYLLGGLVCCGRPAPGSVVLKIKLGHGALRGFIAVKGGTRGSGGHHLLGSCRDTAGGALEYMGYIPG